MENTRQLMGMGKVKNNNLRYIVKEEHNEKPRLPIRRGLMYYHPRNYLLGYFKINQIRFEYAVIRPVRY